MKVLIADDNADRANEVARHLRKTGVGDVVLVRLGESLTNAVATHSPDVIIVDMSRPDRDSLENVRTVTTENPRPIVMFVDHSDVAFMEAAIEAGVSSYNVVGSSMPDVKPIVQTAVAMFRRHQQVAAKLRDAEITINEHTILHRAKLLLIRTHKMDEPEAHRWLQRRAMNRGKRIAEIAAELLDAAKKES